MSNKSETRSVWRRELGTRFVVVCLLIALLVPNLANWFFYHWLKRNLDKDFANNLVSIGTVGSSNVHAENLPALMAGESDESYGLYYWLKKDLKKAKEQAGVDDTYIVDENGSLLVGLLPGDAVGAREVDFKFSDRLKKRLLSGEPVTTPMYRNERGVHFKSVYVPLRDKENDIVGFMGIDAQVPFLDVLMQLKRRMIYTGMASLLVAAGLTLIFTRSFSQTLRRMTYSLATMRKYNQYILESVTGGVITVDLTGRITAFNNAASAILGVDKELSLGRHFEDALGGQGELVEMISESLRELTEVSHKEKVTRRSDGKNVVLSLNASPLEDDENRVIGTTLFFSDVTEVKRLQEVARHREKLAMLGEMSAGMAHEIRNPLGGIELSAELLERKLPPESEQKKLTGNIVREVRKLNKIVTECLLYGRAPALDLQPNNLNEIADSALESSKPKWQGNGVTLVREYDRDMPKVHLDASQMSEVFINLVSNGVEAMKSAGRIVVSTAAVRGLDGKVEAVEFGVSNEGPEIPEDIIDKIFVPFFTTKHNGTGLGLAIVQRIVESHGGTVKVESLRGKGVRFNVRIPV